MTSEPNPAAMWQEWMQKGTEFWSSFGKDAATAPDQDQMKKAFEAWSEAWIRAATQAQSPDAAQTGIRLWNEQLQAWNRTLGMGQQAPGGDPTRAAQQMFSAWSDAWTRFFSEAQSPEVLQRGQKLWSEQLETWTKLLAEAMNTDSFARSISQSTEQALTSLETIQQTLHPQVDATLRLLNLPSRSQINRLFEEIADLQQRMDDLADQYQRILDAVAAPKEPARKPRSGPKRSS